MNNKASSSKSIEQVVDEKVGKRVARALKRSAQVKICDTYRAYTVFQSSSPMRDDLCQVAQGADVMNRVGMWIKPTQLDLNLYLSPSSGSTQSCIFRLMLIQSIGSEVAVPSQADIIDDVNSAITDAERPFCQQNYLTKKTFHILRDEYHIVSSVGTTGDQVAVKWSMKLSLARCEYKGASASIANNVRGRLYLFGLTTEGLLSSNRPIVGYHARIHYVDE